jgi:hypothetical protein
MLSMFNVGGPCLLDDGWDLPSARHMVTDLELRAPGEDPRGAS